MDLLGQVLHLTKGKRSCLDYEQQSASNPAKDLYTPVINILQHRATHSATEYPDLGQTHREHRATVLAVHGTPQQPHCLPGALSKLFSHDPGSHQGWERNDDGGGMEEGW